MISINKKQIKRRHRFYSNNLSNYRSVLKDTDKQILRFSRHEYNCMGYALGSYEWEYLENFRWTSLDDETGELDMEIMGDILHDCVYEILKRCGYVRLINSPKDIVKGERVIAFRLSETDFHWARLGSDGIWTHKPGSGVIKEMTEQELYGEWCPDRADPYISEIVYFAVEI